MFDKGALAILKEDHKSFQNLLKTLTKSRDADEQEQILSELASGLLVHARLEEEFFYPALEDSPVGGQVHAVQRAHEEHELAEKALNDLLDDRPGTESFRAKAEVLRGLVVGHAKEEEKELFSIAKKAMDTEELEELGQQMTARRPALREEVEREITERHRMPT